MYIYIHTVGKMNFSVSIRKY